MQRRRRLPFGAELLPEGIRFGLHAPALKGAAVVFDDGAVAEMRPAGGGRFEAVVEGRGAGTHYRYEIAPGERVPDPASRFQPADIEGPSEVVDPAAYEWRDAAWRGRPWSEAILYELHVGCFGPSGDYAGVEDRLDHLARTGVTALELMPVADFAGRRNWGYDGVLPYAPDSSYGRPEDLKRLVDACHARGLMVLLDVVYNHFGPSGNHLARYAPDFFHGELHTPWGAALAFDNPALRSFFTENALYWLQEFHFDGLRLDAVHSISEYPGGKAFLAELAERVRRETVGREVHLVLENDRNETRWLPAPVSPPRLYTAQWNDDLHHAAHAALTGERDGYYADYAERPLRHLARALAEGFDYQGEYSSFRSRARGETSASASPTAFVSFLQNHDQVGNRAFGERLGQIAPDDRLRALYAALFLSPQVPMLFMGEEWSASTPFLFFCDFPGELGRAVREGRRREFERFDTFADPAARRRIPDPTGEAAFLDSRLDWREAATGGHADWRNFVAALAGLRTRELVPRLERFRAGRYESPSPEAFEVEWPLAGGGRWRLAVDLGAAPAGPGVGPGRLVYAGDGVRVDVDE